jgi:hypothetical protein
MPSRRCCGTDEELEAIPDSHFLMSFSSFSARRPHRTDIFTMRPVGPTSQMASGAAAPTDQ